MMKRHDIHRPSAIRPADYTYIAQDYIGPSVVNGFGAFQFLMAERAAFRAHMEKTKGKYSSHGHGGTCHICGANAFYIAKFYHPKTNSYIVTGCDCAEKMGMGDAAAFRSFRKKVLEARRAEKGKGVAIETLHNLGLDKAWELYTADYESLKINKTVNGQTFNVVPNEETTIRDIVSRLVKYGNISDRATSYVRSLLERIAKRATIEAERAAKYAVAKEVPITNGRVKITGTVLAIKPPDEWSRFGQSKMLLETADGWKVWGSLPTALAGCERGAKVSLEAVLVRSDKDPKFAFFNRPSKAQVIEATS